MELVLEHVSRVGISVEQDTSSEGGVEGLEDSVELKIVRRRYKSDWKAFGLRVNDQSLIRSFPFKLQYSQMDYPIPQFQVTIIRLPLATGFINMSLIYARWFLFLS